MNGRGAQKKGKRAEREVIALLQPVVTAIYQQLRPELEVPQLQRNLMQTHKGGFDVFGLDWCAIEVKHHETLQMNQWWDQCKRQANGREPILFYRKNTARWRVRMFARMVVEGGGSVRAPVDIDSLVFLELFKLRLRAELRK